MRSTSAGVLAVVAGLLAACATVKDETQTIGKTRAPLELSVSAPFYLEAFPTTEIVDTAPLNGKLGCGTQGCLVIYSESPGGHDSMLASRISTAGNLLDVPRILLDQPADGSVIPRAVLPRGSEFLAVWTAGSSTTMRSRAALIRSSDGSVMGDVSAQIPNVVDNVWTTGATILVSYKDQAKAFIKLLAANDLSTVGTPIELPLGTPRVVPGVGQYLLTWQGKAQQLDEATGTFPNPSFDFSRYMTGNFSGVFQGGVYQLVVLPPPPTGTTTSVYGTRIRALDGVVLDPDDEFFQKPGLKLLCDKCAFGDSTTTAGVHVVGSEVLVTWFPATGTGTSGARVDTSTGLRTTGTTASAELVLPKFPIDFGMVSPTEGIGLWSTSSVAKITFTPSPFSISSAITHLTGIAANDRLHPVVAANGTDFLVAWFSNEHLWATRVNGTTGAYVDNPPLDLGQPDPGFPVPLRFAAASSGSDFAVAWMTRANVLGSRVIPSSGPLGAASTLPVATSTAATYGLRLVGNGKYYLAAWYKQGAALASNTIEAIELNANGTMVGTAPLVLGTGMNILATGLGPLGFDLSADTVPVALQRTFLAAWTAPASASEFRLVRSEGGVLINPTHTVAVGGTPLLASDGSRMLVVGSSGLATRLDPVTGTSLDPIATLRGVGAAQGYAPQKVTFDGRSFVVTTMNGGAFASRQSPTLAPMDPALSHGTQVTDRLDEHYFDVASLSTGRSLFVYSNADVARAGFAVTARFIDNDGIPTPGPPDAGPEGGEGGDAQSTGGAPNGGAPATGGTPGDSGTSTGGIASGGGGAPSTGGIASGGGGAPSTGGTASGGTPSTGGITSTGGAPSGSGGTATGGKAGAGTSTGGRLLGTGGKRATGGTNTGGAALPGVEEGVAPPRGDSGGCGCTVPSRSSAGQWWTVAAALVVMARRRRRLSR